MGHPADTIKLRQQTLNTTVTQTIVKTYQNEGIRGFFKGMLFPLLGTGPLNAIFFGVYSNSMRWLNHDDKLDRVSTENPHWLRHVFFSGEEQKTNFFVIDNILYRSTSLQINFRSVQQMAYQQPNGCCYSICYLYW